MAEHPPATGSNNKRHVIDSKSPTSGNKRPILRGKFRSPSVYAGARSSGKKVAHGEDLRQQVREACLDLFKQHFGMEWNPKFETMIGTEPNPNNLEKQARKLWIEIRDVINRAVDFTRKHPVGFGSTGQARNFLAWWVGEFLEPLTHQPVFLQSKADPKHEPFSKIHDASRVRLVLKFERYNMLGLKPYDDGNPRLLDARELAIVSLLCATSERPELKQVRDEHWAPGNKSMTVAEVLRSETDTMAGLLERYGAKYQRFLAWDDALREFGIEPEPYPERDSHDPANEVLIPIRRGLRVGQAKIKRITYK